MRIKTCLALAIAGAACVGSALATTLERLSLKDMTTQADVAIVGEVTATRTVRTDRQIVTVTTLRVVQNGWGAPGNTIDVMTRGGSMQSGKYRLGLTSPGEVLLLKGETSVFLLKADRDSAGNYVIVGFNQGKLQVVKTAQGTTVMMPGGEQPVPVADAMATLKRIRQMPARNGIAP